MIEKPVSAAEPGLSGAMLDITVEQPSQASMITDEDGSVTVDFGGDEDQEQEAESHGSNLAEYLTTLQLGALAVDLTEHYVSDRQSRSEWEKTYIEGLDLLGLKFEDRTTPWEGACGVFHPMLSEAVVRFQAQTIQEIFPATGPCKTSIVGEITTEKTQQSRRVCDYMNYLAIKKMSEYRTETEKLLFCLPIAGSAFRKIYNDPNLGRPAAMFVPAEDCVVSYGASDLQTCERITHIMKRTENDVLKLQNSGFYADVDLNEPVPETTEIQRKYDKLTGDTENYEHDSRHTLLEMQVDLDLEGFEDKDNLGEETGIALPYIVTIEFNSRHVLAIYRNWKEGDPKRLRREHFVHYQYLPGLGFYGFGLIHMIGGLTKSATSILRQLVDAGTLSNLPGGLKSRGLRIKGDDSPIMPGEFRDVDIPSGAIRDNIQFLPYKEPSAVLYQLLGDIVQEGRRFASAADVKASDMNAEAPVGTTLAILEREMKVISAITARVHASMGKELHILSEVITDFGPDEYPYKVDGDHKISDDFDERIDIIPVSDPNAGTMAQRIMQYQAALQLATTAPQMYDMPLLHRQMLEVLGIQDAERIVPTDDDLFPTDPVTETMALINGEPVKAFIYQDHEAHIKVHLNAMQNPQMMELMKLNPNAEGVMAAGAAHLSEHLAFAYRRKIEEELGVELPPPDQPLPEDIELRLSRLVAPAAEQLTGKAQQQAQAEDNAKKQEDPIIQAQQEELRQKAEKIQNDARLGMEKINTDLTKHREGLDSRERIAATQVAAKLSGDQMRADGQADALNVKEQVEGFKQGFEMAEKMTTRDKPNGK